MSDSLNGDVPGGSSRPAPPAGDPGTSPLCGHTLLPQEFHLTFGVGYARNPHPRGPWIHPDGWVTIVAPSFGEARRIVVDLFGICWSDLYDADAFDRALFPRGELLRIMVPAGLLEQEDHRDHRD